MTPRPPPAFPLNGYRCSETRTPCFLQPDAAASPNSCLFLCHRIPSDITPLCIHLGKAIASLAHHHPIIDIPSCASHSRIHSYPISISHLPPPSRPFACTPRYPLSAASSPLTSVPIYTSASALPFRSVLPCCPPLYLSIRCIVAAFLPRLLRRVGSLCVVCANAMMLGHESVMPDREPREVRSEKESTTEHAPRVLQTSIRR